MTTSGCVSPTSSTPSAVPSEVTIFFPGPGGHGTGRVQLPHTGLSLKHYLSNPPLRTYGLQTKAHHGWRVYTRSGVRLRLNDVVRPGEVVVFVRGR